MLQINFRRDSCIGTLLLLPAFFLLYLQNRFSSAFWDELFQFVPDNDACFVLSALWASLVVGWETGKLNTNNMHCLC